MRREDEEVRRRMASFSQEDGLILKDEEVESEEALEALATLHDLPLGFIAVVIFIYCAWCLEYKQKRIITQNSQCVQLHSFTVEVLDMCFIV